jgi:hypothetical protein
MFSSEHFTIDNIKSQDIGVNGCYLIRTNSEVNRQIIGDRDIIENKSPYLDTPFFYKTNKNNIEFDLQFSILEEIYTEDTLFEINKIFAQDRYVTFQSNDYPKVFFYVICTSMSLVTYGLHKGWITVHMRTSAPYAYGLPQISDFDFSDLITPQTFEIFCKSNVMHSLYGRYIYFPKLLIDMKGSATSITFNNLSDGNKAFGFTGLTQGESLEIDNELKKIKSSTGLNRIGNMLTGHPWFYLSYGRNTISINTPAKIQIQQVVPTYI